MTFLKLDDYVAIAQIATPVAAFIGIFVSIFFSRKTLQEVQSDQRMRSRPQLAFETGGLRLRVDFVMAGKAIPGINPEFVKQKFPNLPESAESVRLKESDIEKENSKIVEYGRLKNYGLGSALETEVRWIPRKIWFGSESFNLDKTKRTEPLYCGSLNTMPSCPSHILPGQEARMSRLPTFIEKDFEKKITRVNGIFKITCKDIFGTEHNAYQEFYLFTGYKDTPPTVHVTFGDLINENLKNMI